MSRNGRIKHDHYPNLRKKINKKVGRVAAETNGSESGKGKYIVEIYTMFTYRINWKTKKEALKHLSKLKKLGIKAELINE